MRESNFSNPAQNKACICISAAVYDRRAIDCTATLPLINSLNHLAYLTSTSPRIREMLTLDGGLEKLIRILRQTPRAPTQPSMRGVITKEMQGVWKWTLAFQCVVNIGVRGSENVRTRVVEAGIVPVTLKVLESYLQVSEAQRDERRREAKREEARQRAKEAHSVAAAAAAANAASVGRFASAATSMATTPTATSASMRSNEAGHDASTPTVTSHHLPPHQLHHRQTPREQQQQEQRRMPNSELNARRRSAQQGDFSALSDTQQADSLVADSSLNEDSDSGPSQGDGGSQVLTGASSETRPTTPAEVLVDSSVLVNVLDDFVDSAAASASASAPAQQAVSPNRDADSAGRAASSVPILAAHLDAMPIDASSFDQAAADELPLNVSPASSSSPPNNRAGAMGTSTGLFAERSERRRSGGRSNAEGRPSDLGSMMVPGTLTNVSSVEDLGAGSASGSDAEMFGEEAEGDDSEMEVSQPTRGQIAEDDDEDRRTPRPPRRALMPLAGEARTQHPLPATSWQNPASVGAVEPSRQDTVVPRRSDNSQSAAGSIVESSNTSRDVNGVGSSSSNSTSSQPPAGTPTPQFRGEAVRSSGPSAATIRSASRLQTRNDDMEALPTARPHQQHQFPAHNHQQQQHHHHHHHHHHHQSSQRARGDAATFFSPSDMVFREEEVLLSLQLLAYLSKYAHVRALFHSEISTMNFSERLNHPVQEEKEESWQPNTPPKRNVFSVAERFTIRSSRTGAAYFATPDSKVAPEIQYWAGVIMRNACRKDESRGGLRQCANMLCGKWESQPREFAKCRRCRKAKYCSKQCQSKGWQMGHRFWCSARSDEEGAEKERERNKLVGSGPLALPSDGAAAAPAATVGAAPTAAEGAADHVRGPTRNEFGHDRSHQDRRLSTIEHHGQDTHRLFPDEDTDTQRRDAQQQRPEQMMMQEQTQQQPAGAGAAAAVGDIDVDRQALGFANETGMRLPSRLAALQGRRRPSAIPPHLMSSDEGHQPSNRSRTVSAASSGGEASDMSDDEAMDRASRRVVASTVSPALRSPGQRLAELQPANEAEGEGGPPMPPTRLDLAGRPLPPPVIARHDGSVDMANNEMLDHGAPDGNDAAVFGRGDFDQMIWRGHTPVPNAVHQAAAQRVHEDVGYASSVHESSATTSQETSPPSSRRRSSASRNLGHRRSVDESSSVGALASMEGSSTGSSPTPRLPSEHGLHAPVPRQAHRFASVNLSQGSPSSGVHSRAPLGNYINAATWSAASSSSSSSSSPPGAFAHPFSGPRSLSGTFTSEPSSATTHSSLRNLDSVQPQASASASTSQLDNFEAIGALPTATGRPMSRDGQQANHRNRFYPSSAARPSSSLARSSAIGDVHETTSGSPDEDNEMDFDVAERRRPDPFSVPNSVQELLLEADRLHHLRHNGADGGHVAMDLS